jgi:hypothetical protein
MTSYLKMAALREKVSSLEVTGQGKSDNNLDSLFTGCPDETYPK